MKKIYIAILIGTFLASFCYAQTSHIYTYEKVDEYTGKIIDSETAITETYQDMTLADLELILNELVKQKEEAIRDYDKRIQDTQNHIDNLILIGVKSSDTK
jgi:hypothetical protein